MCTSYNSQLHVIIFTWMLCCFICIQADWVTTDFNVFTKQISQGLEDKSNIQISYNFTQVSEEVVNQNLQFYQAQLFYNEELKTVVNAFDFTIPVQELLKCKRPTQEQLSEFIKGGGYFFKVGGKYKTVTVKRGQLREATCKNCNGEGSIRKFRMNGGDEEKPCPVCHGKGRVADGRKPDKTKKVFDRLQFNVYSTKPLFNSSDHKKHLLSMYFDQNYTPLESVDEEETNNDIPITKDETTKPQNYPPQQRVAEEDNISGSIAGNTLQQNSIINKNHENNETISESGDHEELYDYEMLQKLNVEEFDKILQRLMEVFQRSEAAAIYYGGFSEYLRKFGNGRDFKIVVNEWDAKINKNGLSVLTVNHILGINYGIGDYQIFSKRGDARNLKQSPNDFNIIALKGFREETLNTMSTMEGDKRLSANYIDALSKRKRIDVLLYTAMNYDKRMMALKSHGLTDNRIQRELEDFASFWCSKAYIFLRSGMTASLISELPAESLAVLCSQTYIHYVLKKNEQSDHR